MTLIAAAPAAAHDRDETATLGAVDGEVTNPALFQEFDAEFQDFGINLQEFNSDFKGIGATPEARTALAASSSGVWKRYSWKCKSPAGEKFNISIGYRGPLSQTIYFNNHCNEKRSVRTHYKGQSPGGEPKEGSYCVMTVNPKTKGSKKFIPSNYFPWIKATSNC
ncbi:hypothetical protein [Streptomyces sp. CC77]|uniref:hypothetical protein n=1 Tax=Streptomyces sp. CC77 TaxID=1906739 RepID=UPI0008DDEFEF|nr:hypothetical protein [Streptomyces sp. CC77]OII67473.1 hypothetical protein BJP39_01080 [Streptomyces sp. CC77]